MDQDQTVPIEAVCSGSTLFAFILNSSVMLGNYWQQTNSADDIFRCIFFLALKLRVTCFLICFQDLNRSIGQSNDEMLDNDSHSKENIVLQKELGFNNLIKVRGFFIQ